MKKLAMILVTAAVAASSIPVSYAQTDSVDLYVSENGSDYGDGTAASPYKTLERAVRAIRYIGDDYSHINIIFREGNYIAVSGVQMFSDSVPTGTSITFKGYENEKVSINSAYELIPQTGSVTDSRIADSVRANIKCVDVSGLKLSDGEETYTLNKETGKLPFAVYQESELMTSARYPNRGEIEPQYMSIESKSKTKDVASYSVQYTEDDEARIESWSGKDNIYICGFPNVMWEYSKTKVSGFDSETNKISVNGGINADSGLENAKFWFSNIIEELDAPGEYYYDKDNEKIYYYPVNENDNLYVSKSKNPIFELINASNIEFKNITFEGAAENGIEIYGGSNISFDNCTFKNIAKKAVVMSNNTNCSVTSCDFTNIGCGGILIDSDRYNLAEQNNVIENCSFSKYDMIQQVYGGAARISGVKNVMRYCDIQDDFHLAVVVQGNENVVEYCKITNVCQGTNDAGAVYAYGDSTSRGNIIRNNYISKIGKSVPTETTGYGTYGTWGIYLDGYTSGYTVENNILDTLVRGVFVNNGGYNTVSGNIFNNVAIPVVCCGARDPFDKPAYADAFKANYYNSYYNADIWLKKYPEMAELRSVVKPSEYYKNNTITNNEYYGSLCLYCDKTTIVNGVKQDVISQREGENTVFENNVKYTENYQVNTNDFGKRN